MARVVIGLSGGVDSSVAAYLLQQAGHEVIGLFMINWHDTTGTLEGDCPWHDDRLFAELVARRLDIPFHTVDLSDQYRRRVVDYMFSEYAKGRTPNPDVLCNREIKFDVFLKEALKLGADFVATGHYCRKAEETAPDGRTIYKLLAGSDPNKDQSYFLCRLTQEQLSRTLFPLGDLEKPAVRALAEAHGLINAQKRDSQDICFVPDGDYVSFITRCVGHESPTGPFVDREGRVLGQHKGFIRYTKGQHKGLDLAIEPPLYVLRKDPADHAVYLGHNEDLFTSELIAGDWNWISIPALTAPMTVTVKTRYSQREAEAVAEPLSGGQVRLRFREPQRAVTPGQFVVLYDGDAVVGGGVILE